MRVARWTVSIVGLGLVVAGCGSAPPAAPAPPPPPAPPATRALVAWSESLCTTVKQVDGLRTGIDKVTAEPDPVFAGSRAESYTEGVPDALDQALAGMKELKPSGVKAADAAVADIVKALTAVGPQLPPSNPADSQASDQQKIARAKQMAAVLAKVPAAGPKLTGVISHDAGLAASYNVAPDCAPVPPVGRPAPHSPTRAMVVWSDTMCLTARTVTLLAADPLPSFSTDPMFAQFDGPVLGQYLNSAHSQVDNALGEVVLLQPTGVKAADTYTARLAAGLREALTKVPEHDGSGLDVPVDELKQEAGQVAATIAPLKASADPTAAVASDPALTAAYGLAPQCEPPAPPKGTLPHARNGSDFAACQGGTCQVQVSGNAEVTASGLKFTIRVTGGRVSITDGSGGSQVGPGGEAGFSQAGGRGVKIHVTGAEGTTAVLDISPS